MAAVFVAIAIPVFTTQLERSREATDLSNIRAAYAEVMAEYLANGATGTPSAVVTARQTQSGWQNPANSQLQARVNGSEYPVTVPGTTTNASGEKWNVTIDTNKSELVAITIGTGT